MPASMLLHVYSLPIPSSENSQIPIALTRYIVSVRIKPGSLVHGSATMSCDDIIQRTEYTNLKY